MNLVIGPWASGKSTLAEHLLALVPRRTVVFDWDLIIPGLSVAAGKDVRSDPSTWEGLKAIWNAVIEVVLASSLDVVLLGPISLEEWPVEVRNGSMRCAYIDCPDEILKSRLRQRGATEAEVIEELELAAKLRLSNYRCIQAANRAPAEIAEEVAKWIREGR